MTTGTVMIFTAELVQKKGYRRHTITVEVPA
jgi:hypothetical protein